MVRPRSAHDVGGGRDADGIARLGRGTSVVARLLWINRPAACLDPDARGRTDLAVRPDPGRRSTRTGHPSMACAEGGAVDQCTGQSPYRETQQQTVVDGPATDRAA